MGADFNGTVLGTRVTEHHETPGLAIKSNCAFRLDHHLPVKNQWCGGAPWEVKKDGGDFDQFTGTTISPRAWLMR
ncbi:FMN-binding protein [Shigella flexneri]